jgi:hypothetical protein
MRKQLKYLADLLRVMISHSPTERGPQRHQTKVAACSSGVSLWAARASSR